VKIRPYLPFALPDIGEEEIAEVVDSLRSGWITTGPKVRRFEADFSQRMNGRHAIAVNSATAGLHLALEAIGIEPGDKVLTTTHTFTATAEVVRYFGADPVLIDIDLRTYCLDVSQLSRAVTPNTKAVIPVHYGGRACEMESILDFARRHRLRVIEDAAHAFPTTADGRLVGTLGSDATVFSFYATKTIATGEGGMLVTCDARLAARARVMRLHGIDRDTFDRYTSKQPAWYYEVIAPGFKYNMTDIAAALGIHQLRKAEHFQTRREAMAKRYNEELKDLPIHLPPGPAKNDRHAWHLYVIRLNDDARIERDTFIYRLADHGISSSVHYIPLHRQPYWRERYALRPEAFPNSELLYKRGVSLPIYTRMTDDDQTRVIAAVRSALE
jgi:dTDP-4-amino-4,6-dideoxygalactose transaminase